MLHAEQGVSPEAVAEAYHAYEQGSQVAPLSAAAVSNQTIQESQRLLLLVRAYQVRPGPLVDLCAWDLQCILFLVRKRWITGSLVVWG